MLKESSLLTAFTILVKSFEHFVDVFRRVMNSSYHNSLSFGYFWSKWLQDPLRVGLKRSIFFNGKRQSKCWGGDEGIDGQRTTVSIPNTTRGGGHRNYVGGGKFSVQFLAT